MITFREILEIEKEFTKDYYSLSRNELYKKYAISPKECSRIVFKLGLNVNLRQQLDLMEGNHERKN